MDHSKDVFQCGLMAWWGLRIIEYVKRFWSIQCCEIECLDMSRTLTHVSSSDMQYQKHCISLDLVLKKNAGFAETFLLNWSKMSIHRSQPHRKPQGRDLWMWCISFLSLVYVRAVSSQVLLLLCSVICGSRGKNYHLWRKGFWLPGFKGICAL